MLCKNTPRWSKCVRFTPQGPRPLPWPADDRPRSQVITQTGDMKATPKRRIMKIIYWKICKWKSNIFNRNLLRQWWIIDSLPKMSLFVNICESTVYMYQYTIGVFYWHRNFHSEIGVLVLAGLCTTGCAWSVSDRRCSFVFYCSCKVRLL